MSGREITITSADGASFSGYLAQPESGGGPGLLLAQEIFGVNASMRAVADYFAEEGYVYLVPDLFWRIEPGVELGYSQAEFDEAFGLYQKFDVDLGIDNLGAALNTLRQLPECTGEASVMGFCLGGRLAYLVATRHDPAVAICFYGCRYR